MRTRSVASLPVALSAGMFVCSLVWSIYGVYVADITILIPNAIGVSLAATQIALFARYVGTPESKEAAALAAKAAAGGVGAPGESDTAPLVIGEVSMSTELGEVKGAQLKGEAGGAS